MPVSLIKSDRVNNGTATLFIFNTKSSLGVMCSIIPPKLSLIFIFLIIFRPFLIEIVYLSTSFGSAILFPFWSLTTLVKENESL